MKTCEYCGQVLLDDRDCTCDGAVAERKNGAGLLKRRTSSKICSRMTAKALFLPERWIC